MFKIKLVFVTQYKGFGIQAIDKSLLIYIYICIYINTQKHSHTHFKGLKQTGAVQAGNTVTPRLLVRSLELRRITLGVFYQRLLYYN